MDANRLYKEDFNSEQEFKDCVTNFELDDEKLGRICQMAHTKLSDEPDCFGVYIDSIIAHPLRSLDKNQAAIF